MEFGVVGFLDDRSVGIAELATAVEAAGLESLFLTEHTHVPVRRETEWPPGRVARDEARLLDPLIALAAGAAVTHRIRLGTAICLVSERDPIVLAKEVATVDHLSKGRFMFGVGSGWVTEELRNHGTDPARRWSVAEDRIRAMKEIWTHDEAEFHGRYVDFDPIWSWPKPAQRPHPPVLIGGNAARTLHRVVEVGDGWIPIAGANLNLPNRMAELERIADAAAKPVPPVTVCLWRLDADHVVQLRDAGAERCLANIPVTTLAAVNEFLDLYSEVIRTVGR